MKSIPMGLLACCLVFGGVPSQAAVESLVESFSGTGAYDGFDLPGWRASPGMTLTEQGATFSNRGYDGRDNYIDGDGLTRVVNGRGSFAARVALRNLDFGTPNPGQDEVGTHGKFLVDFYRIFSQDADFFWISDLPKVKGVPNWKLGYIPASGLVNHALKPARELALEYIYDIDADNITLIYDTDVDDPLILGPYARTRTTKMSESFGMSLEAVAIGGSRADGIIDYWSVTPLSDLAGDFDGSNTLNAADIERVHAEARAGAHNPRFDLNGDRLVDHHDGRWWVHTIRGTRLGDVNLDGAFDSLDVVQIFAAGEYEDTFVRNSHWATGDINGDQEFSTSDLILAFADGGYQTTVRSGLFDNPSSAAVPEMTGGWLWLAVWGFVARQSVLARRKGAVRTRPLFLGVGHCQLCEELA